MKKIALITCSFLFCLVSFSQDFSVRDTTKKKEKKRFPDWQKVYIGGDLGMQFGRDLTLINIAPDIGYRITERYSAGFGLRYMYFENRFYNPVPKLSIFGGSVFNRLVVTDFLFLHGEYEVLNGPWARWNSERFNLNNVWVGGGLRQAVGNSALNLMALWNLNVEPYNPFPNPQIRMGVSIGL